MGLKPKEPNKKAEGLAAVLLDSESRSSSIDKSEDLNKALNYVLGAEQRVEFVEGGNIKYEIVSDLLKDVVQSTGADKGPAREGRLGPARMEIDEDSRFGNLVFSEDSRFTVESKGNFSSCRSTHCFFAGRWMYEAVIDTGGIQQIGWATLDCPFNREEGVGDGEDSYAFDGKRVKKWNMDPAAYGQTWAPGDVIGCCADFDKAELTFYRNGKSMGTAFRNIRTLKPELGYFPAISLSEGERCTMNYGAKPFYYPIDNYAPCDDQPPDSERKAVSHFMRCLERLVEVTSEAGELSTSTPRFQHRISTDEKVLLGYLIVNRLAPFLKKDFHVFDSVLHSFRRVLGKAEALVDRLTALMEILHASLAVGDFNALVTKLVRHAADSCVVSPFKATELPNTASWQHLSLIVSMLKIPRVKRLVFNSHNLHYLLEQCLRRKQPTEDDLKDLLPNMWWPGCKDDTLSEELMDSLVSTLSGAYLKIEQLQHELLMMVALEDAVPADRHWSSREPRHALLKFCVHLLDKNAGAARNIPPPGLSDGTVLISLFNFLLALIKPYFFLQKSEMPEVLSEFPAKGLFVRGFDHRWPSTHETLPRLGGMLSHVKKENPEVYLENVFVRIETEVLSAEQSRYSVPRYLIPDLLHVLVVSFRLGIDSAFKLFQSEVALKSALLKNEGKLVDPTVPEGEKRRITSELQKQKEELIKCIRESSWYRIVWFSHSKQKSMFLLTVYISKLIASISSTNSNLFSYIPEVYVEVVLEIFQALTKIEGRFGEHLQLELLGLQHVVAFLINHFDNEKIINPQICDTMLQTLGTVFADKEFIKTCEKVEDGSKQHLIPRLIKAFDSRYWLSVSNIFLSISKGIGFGHYSNNGGSPEFRKRFAATCTGDKELMNGFLNRLFNTLNWTMTELVIILCELAELLDRAQSMNTQSMIRQPRKTSILFSLSTNLLKMLEFVVSEVPECLVTGSRLHIARISEVVGYVLSHATTGPDSVAFEKVLSAPLTGQDWKNKMSRAQILAPVAGILVYLHEKAAAGSSDEHDISEVLADESAIPTDRLTYLREVDWKSNFSNIHKTDWVNRLDAVIGRYEELKKIKDQQDRETVEDIPDEFLDPITMTVMKDPVILPDSKISLDRSTIERHLLSSETDPFSRAELTVDMLIPNTELRLSIENWNANAPKKGRLGYSFKLASSSSDAIQLEQGGGSGGSGVGKKGTGGDGSGEGDANLSPEIIAILSKAGRAADSFAADFQKALLEGKVSTTMLQRYIDMEKNFLMRLLFRIDGFRQRLLADPGFLFKVAVECGIGIGTKSAAEYTKRQDNFWKELDFVTANVIMAILADFMLVWLPAPTLIYNRTMTSKTLLPWFKKCPDNAFQVVQKGTQPFTGLQRFGSVIRNGTKLFGVGVFCSFIGVASTNLLIYLRTVLDPEFQPQNQPQNVATMALGYGAYMATSSNLRYQIVAGVLEERGIEVLFKNQRQVISVLSLLVRTANTFVGSLLWVDFCRITGLQKSTAKAKK